MPPSKHHLDPGLIHLLQENRFSFPKTRHIVYNNFRNMCSYKKFFLRKLKIADKSRLEKFMYCALFCAIAAIGISPPSGKTHDPLSFAEQNHGETEYLKTLRQIYAEVKELGPYPGEGFVSREFFVGEDDDDTNKNTHIVILIQNIEGQGKMKIQVTDMEPSQANPQVKYAKGVKKIACLVTGDNVSVQSSDYKERELEKLIPGILHAIQDKEKLLKL
jgi:hypothetical protein